MLKFGALESLVGGISESQHIAVEAISRSQLLQTTSKLCTYFPDTLTLPKK